MDTTTTQQAKLNRLFAEADARRQVDAVVTTKRGTARWNGTVWVYDRRNVE